MTKQRKLIYKILVPVLLKLFVGCWAGINNSVFIEVIQGLGRNITTVAFANP